MGKFTAFKLPLKSLGVGTHEFEYHLDKQFFVDMESADVRDADLDVHLDVQYNGDFYTLDFTIEGDAVVLCDRCLDDLTFPIDVDYHIVVKYGEDYNDDNDEVLEIPESDNTLNVAYMLYDTVVLAIPMKHVHPQGECNRQMSAMLKKHQALNINEDADFDGDFVDDYDNSDSEASAGSEVIDPRWAALKKLSDDNNISE